MSLDQKGITMIPRGSKYFKPMQLFKSGPGSKYEVEFEGKKYNSGHRWWGQPKEDIEGLIALKRIEPFGSALKFIRYLEDFPYKEMDTLWDGIGGASSMVYVVQTNEEGYKKMYFDDV